MRGLGSVSTFAIPDAVSVYIDISVRQYDTLFPACASPCHVIELSPDEIFQYGHAIE